MENKIDSWSLALALPRAIRCIDRFYCLQRPPAQLGVCGLQYRAADDGGHRADYLQAQPTGFPGRLRLGVGDVEITKLFSERAGGTELDAQNLAGVAPDNASRSGGTAVEMKGPISLVTSMSGVILKFNVGTWLREMALALNMGWWIASAHNNRAEFLHRVE
jgi:hypothetical protein